MVAMAKGDVSFETKLIEKKDITRCKDNWIPHETSPQDQSPAPSEGLVPTHLDSACAVATTLSCNLKV